MSMPPGSKRPLEDLGEKADQIAGELAEHWRDIAHATQEQLDEARAENARLRNELTRVIDNANITAEKTARFLSDLGGSHVRKMKEVTTSHLLRDAEQCHHVWVDPSNERVEAGTWKLCARCGVMRDLG